MDVRNWAPSSNKFSLDNDFLEYIEIKYNNVLYACPCPYICLCLLDENIRVMYHVRLCKI